MGLFSGGNKKSQSIDNTRDYYLEEESVLTEYGDNATFGGVNTDGRGNTVNVTTLDGGAIHDSFLFAETANINAGNIAKGAFDFGKNAFDYGETMGKNALSFAGDALDMSESVTVKNISSATDLSKTAMQTLQTLTQDALEGAQAASQRETETAMFALQKANVITGDMPTSTIEKLAQYAAVASVLLYIYFATKGK